MLDNYDDYKTGGTHKFFTISVVGENITITNENLRTESIVLDEELCSSTNLKFGSCGTSKFTAEIANVFENFEGKLINVTVTMDNEVTKYGTFKVFSDKPIADRIYRSLTAYDAMKDIIKTNVLSWYKSLTFPMTLKNFRDSFFNYLGITQETTTLVNDNFIIPGGFTTSDALMGGTIITAICEMNGVFGHINRDGKFEYIDLTQSESFECPPYENGSVTYEDYVTSPITKVTMRGTASDVGTSVGVAGNEYIIQGNPLIYGTEGTQALTTAITNLLNKIKTIVFRPFDLRKTIGNPCVEIGDAITIDTKYETVNSYVLRRTLTGIQALRDRYSALGSKVYPAEATSYQNEITRSKGKMHEFEVTLEGFSSRVTEVESDVEGLDSDLHTNYSTTTEMNSAIEQSAEGIRTEVSQTYVNQTTYNAEVQRLQDEIDGAIESYTGSAVPTLNNYPAEDWTTTTERDKHLGDLYLVNASGGSYAGFYYRFDKSGSTYSWVHIPDNEVQKALADAAEANQKAEAAQATADGIADNLSDNYSTTQQMNSAINQKADEINQTVSTTYETKSDATSKLNTANTNAQGYATQAKNDANAATDTKLTNYYTKTQTDSAITQKANEITLNVSENYTTKTEFGNLEIGGRNLFYRMRYSNAEFLSARAGDIAFDDYTYCMTATGADMYVYNVGNTNASYNTSNGALIPIKAGDSVYIKTYDMINATNVFKNNYITLWNANKVSLGYTYFNKAEGVYTVPEGSQAAYMSFRFGYATAVTGTRYKVRVKIERGNKPTDWSPAPEDVDEKKGLRNYFLCFRSSASTYPNRFVAFNDSYECTLDDYQNTGSFTRFWNLTVPMSTFLNRTVRLSFDAISPNGATALNVYNQNGTPKYNIGYYTVVPQLTTSWQHYSIPITVTENSASGASIEMSDKIEFYAPSKMGVKIRNVKLEMNATETAWTLAPEDETNMKEAQGYANTAETTAKSYTDAQLQITSSSILSTVEQGYTTKTEFDNLSIGGENILMQTNRGTTGWDKTVGSKWKAPTLESITWLGRDALKVTGNGVNDASSSSSYHVLMFLPTGGFAQYLIPDTEYTISFDSTFKHTRCQFQQANGTGAALTGYISLTTTQRTDQSGDTYWHHVGIGKTKTDFTGVNTQWTKVYFDTVTYFETAGSVAKYANLKIEEGNRATDWSPSPVEMSSKSEVQQLSNMVAIKVNSSGRLVTAALGVDPASATSYVKVKADDIDIISNGNIQLTGKSIGISSTNFSVTPAGVVTCSNITASGGKIGDWDIVSDGLSKTSGGYTATLYPFQIQISNGSSLATLSSHSLNIDNIETLQFHCGYIITEQPFKTRFNIDSNGNVDTAGTGLFGGILTASAGLKTNTISSNSGSTVTINSAMTVNSNGKVSTTSDITSGGELIAGYGMELGMASADAAALIDFHWDSNNTDFTARIWQRSENTVDLIGKNSSTWGIWRAASFNSQSSKYVKKNIKDVTEKEARNILKLRPVKFDYKNSDLTNQRGLIAEEVLEIMPEMVNVPKDYTGFNKDEPWNTPSIDYSKFVPYLIKMIQILQKEIDDLKK